MNARNVRLIFDREVRDQLRDRRTLFMIFVLPMLLYPLLGMSLFQVAQFMREHAVRVLLIGADSLPQSPALLDGDRFATRWFADVDKANLLEVVIDPVKDEPGGADKPETPQERAKRAIAEGDFEAVIFVPPDFGEQLSAFRAGLEQHAAQGPAAGNEPPPKVPSPEIFFNTAKEKSQLAYLRASRVLNHWTDEIGRENLATTKVPERTVRPFAVTECDVAEEEQKQAAVWSKILPFLLLIWALTGAFYPAVDLCAGEKERGTLETLLTSPAQRVDIVVGKLLTVMAFSIATAVLNIASIGLTGWVVSSQLPILGPPPLWAPVWLLIALLPISVMFSALCLALAAFAKSTKEGQYYLMPLVLVTMPLVILPMAPGVELSLGHALIPVTGVMLLLRQFLEGNYLAALPFVPPVVAVTLACTLLAIRWAVDQFSSEQVLFRESERLDVGLWFRHLMRDCESTPTLSAALFCGVLILVLRFFMSFALPQPEGFVQLATTTFVLQLAVIATPALLMTILFTRSPRETLQLKRPSLGSLPAAALLAVTLHPLVQLMSQGVNQLYPVDPRLTEAFSGLLKDPPSVLWLIAVFALTPAVFEELAFRGFVLSGCRRMGHKWEAIGLSALFFGLAHPVLQQSIMATLTGLVIGYIAVQSGSILPGMIYHLVHNSVPLLLIQLTPETLAAYPWLAGLGTIEAGGGMTFSTTTLVLTSLLALLLLVWFRGLPYQPTPEESLQAAIAQQTPQQAAV